jgi:hypothetical protein
VYDVFNNTFDVKFHQKIIRALYYIKAVRQKSRNKMLNEILAAIQKKGLLQRIFGNETTQTSDHHYMIKRCIDKQCTKL